jgi:ABC-type uncharacterized transport system involved in gliding motility auxiliary subunit
LHKNDHQFVFGVDQQQNNIQQILSFLRTINNIYQHKRVPPIMINNKSRIQYNIISLVQSVPPIQHIRTVQENNIFRPPLHKQNTNDTATQSTNTNINITLISISMNFQCIGITMTMTCWCWPHPSCWSNCMYISICCSIFKFGAH